jgi:hypothetical protein
MSATLDSFWKRLKHARNAPRVREQIFADAERENGEGFATSLRKEWEIWEADRCLRDQTRAIRDRRSA